MRENMDYEFINKMIQAKKIELEAIHILFKNSAKNSINLAKPYFFMIEKELIKIIKEFIIMQEENKNTNMYKTKEKEEREETQQEKETQQAKKSQQNRWNSQELRNPQKKSNFKTNSINKITIE